MWKGPGQDPGGGSDSGPPPGGSSQELSDLKDQFEQQQVLIAQLKEMLRKSDQSSVTQEKVDEYMNTLSKHSARAKKSKRDDDGTIKKTVDIPASQKITLLRQQVEENKAKFAKRGESKKGIEEMVTQLKAQLDDSQQLINQTPLNLSLLDTSKVEYSENSSAQELYLILLTKEKRITDLLAKVQKLESNVIDLQENVKEKDSVIDARTKAITLMTENLSRKGKTAVDALDETKEQMRKMQENFVAMEAEMKARQMKLLEDLRLKNYEITDLQEVNTKLQREIDDLKENNQLSEETDVGELKEKIKQLEQQLQQSSSAEERDSTIDKLSSIIKEHELTITQLHNTIEKYKKKEKDSVDGDELSKLKKQLEESNKNMIKVKAQHKSKVKELNKKIDQFKKISDSNAEIVRLEAENCRLHQKVAELEEEKGSLQLKLVESDSVKSSDAAERHNELEAKIENYVADLEEKEKIISILESEISRSKTEIETLNDKLNGLSHLENSQVSTEMASIQFEEQMDTLRSENQQLITEKEEMVKEKQELLETIEVLKKEKQELSTKLEHYIQENMELIDKLEKLSAEKVSSAESIEIVEGLTQQEKLELEAYQKNLDMVAGNLKTSEENLPQTTDLNESVNELTEETSELLQKIELFTVERREVMEKMEELKQENNSLNLKIKEIENNRDVLAETYEQLQSEKEVLATKLEVVEKENEELKEKEIKSDQQESGGQLSEENDVLKQQLNQELKQINELKEELDNYKTLLEEKKVKTDELSASNQTLQSRLVTQEQEINQLNNNIIDLNRSLSDYENENKNLQIKITQLEEHKSNLNQLIDKNQEELEAISNTEWENRRLLESKDNEITKLMKERDNTESVILDLQKVIKEKDEKFHKISTDMKEKYLTLQKQLEDNSGNLQNITAPLEAKIEELTTKNKEQLEKMKKIAANLKKKNQEYHQLEEKLKETQNKHEVEMKTSLQQLQDLEAEVSRLQQLHDQKVEEVKILDEKNVELQSIIVDLKSKSEKSQAVSLEQELLLTRENLGSIESSLRSKIQELEMIVETQESELIKSKERVNKLEEGIAFIEGRRMSLEKKAVELGAQLEEKSLTCEEMSRSEDMLEQRLQALTAHDEAIEKKLQEAMTENQDLSQQNKKLSEKNEKLKKKLEQVVDKLKKLENQRNLIEELETRNEEMKQQIHCLENDVANYTKIIEENRNDFDKFNGDWQAQFDEILREKTDLMVRCEKFEEELREITEKELGFNDELIEYKMKLEASEAEIKNYEEQVQQLSIANEEWENLRKIIEEKDNQLETYQKKQLDYEAQIQHLTTTCQELEHLKNTIEEKNTQIDSYHQQTTEYEQQNQKLFDINEDLEKLKKIILEKDEQILHYQQQIDASSFFDQPPIQQELELVNKLQEELNASKLKVEELQKQIQELDVKKTAEMAVNSVITEAEVRASPQKDIPTFVWSSGQTEDPFDFVQQKTASQSEAVPFAIENSQQELLDKIKTLEFMLYTTEKEKEDALSQCNQLTNELTRLVYARQQQLPPLQSTLESQILTESDTTDNTQELRKLEFAETKPPVTSSMECGPIVEEVIQPKDAYLCYGEDTNTLESQILQAVDIQETPETRQELRHLEYEQTRQPQPPSDQPVQEDACGSKDAYLCYTFGENDDGWGWGPEEAKLEEEHIQRTEGAPFRQIEPLKEKIRVLELERENHLEEIKQLQIKSGKLIKKLKEFKQKNEELSQSKKKADLFNLDDAIQEELKLQIEQVEKRLKETTTELEKEKNEKSAILKRIDVLTAAHERMLEMKEKQDVELLSWQRQYGELSAKLERFEWGDDGFSTTDPTPPQEKTKTDGDESLEQLHRKIEELNDTIKELTLDNEELQTLLEEQRTLRINAEKTKAVPENMKTETEYLEVVNQLQLSGEEKKQLQDQVNELIKKNEELLHKFENIEKQNSELVQLISTKEVIIERLNENVRILEEERSTLGEAKKSILEELQEKNFQMDNLVQNMNQEKEGFLNEKFQTLEEEKRQLMEELSKEKEVIFKELQEKSAQIDQLKESMEAQITSLKTELENQTKSAQTLLEENKLLTETISGKDTELTRLTATLEQMAQEWEMRVDQRGNDVAESWKLHLESRETEFAQIQEMLRKEINELEEKSNALVNENNELRKNVDAEIRNEVDRVAALQQQITDRQQYINELNRALQDAQTEIQKLQQELVRKNDELVAVQTHLEEEKQIVDAIIKAVNGDQMVRSADSILTLLSEKENSLKEELQKMSASFSQLREDYDRKSEELRILQERQRGLLDEKNGTIFQLTNRLQEVQNLKDYESENVQNLQQNLLEYQQIHSSISAQLQAKNSQLEEKETELSTLKRLLEERQREHDTTLENLSQEYRASVNEQSQEIENLKRRLHENENHYEELISNKDSEMEGVHMELRHQSQIIADKNKEIEEMSTQLQIKMEECGGLQKTIEEQNVLLEDENKQLMELKGIIEEQVLKIEELKQELYQKSNDYDSVIAEVDLSRSKAGESSTSRRVDEDEDLSEPVSRAELDLALYMLHQRDVRCEELTVELTQLLEERDTLQLRLSNVIREKEELARKMTKEEVGETSTSVPKTPEVAVEASDSLTTKLSELRTVGYKKDKTILDEQEQRRMQQMSIMQQHRDVASRLPPEAAARLVDASYTLSRDVQSPSKVLLNWLWGRSTPRVNNI